MSAVWAVAVADVKDRARRPVFAVALVAAAALGYFAAPPASAGYTLVKVGAFRGVYDSAYLGVMFAMIGALWLSWIGFYLVRGSLSRDSDGGVGQLLAPTPLRTPAYLAGKFLANAVLLTALGVTLTVAAPVVQLARAEARPVNLVELWLPFALLCLPVLLIAAAGALLFDAVRPLRGGLGNIVWLFAFGGLFLGWFTRGFAAITDTMRADVAAQHPGAGSEFSVGFTGEDAGLGTFAWSGLDRTGGLLALPAVYALVALVAALAPSLWFGRFDPDRRTPRMREPASVGTSAPPASPGVPAAYPLAPVARRARSLAAGELRVLLARQPAWWWIGLPVLAAAGLVLPVAFAGMALLAAWVWPILTWSRLGTAAHDNGVDALLAAAPARCRRLLSAWAAGVLVALLSGIGALIRLCVGGDGAAVLAWVGGALLIPALAIALGTASRSPRPFQVVWAILWYLQLNGVAAADVTGALRAGGQAAGPSPITVIAAAAALVVVALIAQEARHANR
jgi:hypothetical protein